MPDNRPTYEIASPHIAPYVQPLWHGALALPFNLRDEDGRRLNLDDDHLCGRTLVLVLLNNVDDEQAVATMSVFAEQEPRLDALDATVIAVNSSSHASHNRALKRQAGFQWPIAGDSMGGVFASYGLHKESGSAVRIVVLTPFRQVRAWFDSSDDINETVSHIMDSLENRTASEDAHWDPPHAPVLIVPNVLTPEECAGLVDSFESGEPFMVRPPQPGEIQGNYKIPVYEHDRQDRVDQIIKDKNTLALLDERLWGRITPMIQKCFGFEVTRREDLHVARYVGDRGGIEMGHRDNSSPQTAYRRFALSMALNDDYEGGAVVFKEFSPRGYRLPAGHALIFSSSLLHEVQETTSGVRYNLISHLFSESTLPT